MLPIRQVFDLSDNAVYNYYKEFKKFQYLSGATFKNHSDYFLSYDLRCTKDN
jgi:hypothetical protein